MIAVRVFDPAMCCSTGICGPSVDPELARFAADLDWLKNHGVAVERFNLAQQPAAFAADAAVKTALETKGEAGLPLVKVNGEVKSSGTYPSRDELASWAGISAAETIGGAAKDTANGCCGPAAASTSKETTSSCCGPAKAESSASKEMASGCCGPTSKTESSAPKKSSCC